MSESNGGNPRLDRIEAALELIVQVQAGMQQEHKALLTAQVVPGGEMRQLGKKTDERFQALAKSQQRMAEAQQRMDDALTALIGTVDALCAARRNGKAPGN